MAHFKQDDDIENIPNKDGSNRSKSDFFFKNMSYKQRRKLRFDEEALYSVSDCISSDKITNILLKLDGITTNSSIIDMTACIGGNVISFAKQFQHVIAIELNKNRYDMLKYNVDKVMQLKNVFCVCGDSLDVIQDMKFNTIQDILFIDPPWGGVNYKKNIAIHLQLNDMDIGEIVCKLFMSDSPIIKYIAIKIPVNFALNHFKKNIEHIAQVILFDKTLRKMSLIVVSAIEYS